MKYIKYSVIYLMLHGSLMAIGGIGVSGYLGPKSENQQELSGHLNLNSESNGSNLVGTFFIYLDVLPADLAIEYSREWSVEPIAVNLNLDLAGTDLDQTYNEDLFAFRQSNYFTLRKEILGVSIPFLAKAGIHLGGGYNTHSTISPSINLLTQLMNDVEPDELIDSIDGEIEYNINNIMDYATKADGYHIQAGIQGKLLALNIFINGRYTFVDLQDLKGFSTLSMGLAFGI